MLRNKGLSMILNVDFMTLTILKLVFFSFIFLEFIMYLMASTPICFRKPSILCNFIIFKKIDSHLFNITYLHTTCTIFLKYVDWVFFFIINCLALFTMSIYSTKTMHQLLCFKSKFPNHFVFTLGRY
jgi:hypothetical protein